MNGADSSQDAFPSVWPDEAEIVVRLSEEIDAIDRPELDPPDEALESLLARCIPSAVGASHRVLHEIDVLLADDAFHGSIYDSAEGRVPSSRMSRQMETAILNGADNAIRALVSQTTAPDAVVELFDELDAVPSADEPLQQVLTDQALTESNAVRRNAADQLGEYITRIECGQYPVGDSKVMAVEISQLIEQAEIRKNIAFDGLAAIISQGQISHDTHDSQSDYALAAGSPQASQQPRWDDFLDELHRLLNPDEQDGI